MTYLLLLLATVPPVLFMVFIYWMDRHEPESLKNIMIALLLGALSTIPALIIQLVLGFIPLFHLPGITGGFFESFLLVAPSEEFFKFLVIYLFIRKKPFFDEINDGIVYFGTGAIGFALLENIFYVLENGFGVGLLRAFTSIPLHTFCGVIIGYHVGLARFTRQTGSRLLILRGLILATITHALFNTLLSSGNLVVLLFIPLVILIYVVGFLILRHGRTLSLRARPQTPMGTTIANAPIHAVAPSAAFIFPGQFAAPPVVNYRPEDVLMDENGRRYLVSKKEIWKAVLARTLLIVSVLFWLVVFLGNQAGLAGIADLVIGSFILTVIPILIGILLEVSYQRRKRKRIYIRT
jgi:protease PrsW